MSLRLQTRSKMFLLVSMLLVALSVVLYSTFASAATSADGLIVEDGLVIEDLSREEAMQYIKATSQNPEFQRHAPNLTPTLWMAGRQDDDILVVAYYATNGSKITGAYVMTLHDPETGEMAGAMRQQVQTADGWQIERLTFDGQKRVSNPSPDPEIIPEFDHEHDDVNPLHSKQQCFNTGFGNCQDIYRDCYRGCEPDDSWCKNWCSWERSVCRASVWIYCSTHSH
jgi:hypothetical protein